MCRSTHVFEYAADGELLNQRITIFEKNSSGTIKIDDLYLAALLNALPNKNFQNKECAYRSKTKNASECIEKMIMRVNGYNEIITYISVRRIDELFQQYIEKIVRFEQLI